VRWRRRDRSSHDGTGRAPIAPQHQCRGSVSRDRDDPLSPRSGCRAGCGGRRCPLVRTNPSWVASTWERSTLQTGCPYKVDHLASTACADERHAANAVSRPGPDVAHMSSRCSPTYRRSSAAHATTSPAAPVATHWLACSGADAAADQPSDSKISARSSTVVRGFTTQHRNTVSPRHEDGTTNERCIASWSSLQA